MSFVETFIMVLFFLAFFIISGYAVIFFLMTPHNRIPGLHWSVKLIWYWGITFIIFVLAGTLLSFVGFLALKIYGG